MAPIQSALTADITLHTLEQATAESPRARRNLLIGIWAGRRLALSDSALPHYALDVMWADHAESGSLLPISTRRDVASRRTCCAPS